MLLSFPLALLSSFLVPFESLALLETSANTIGSAPFMFVNILSRSLAGNRPYKTPSSFILRTIALDFTEFFTAASSLNSVNCAVKNSSKLLYFFPLAFKHPVLISYDNPFSKVVRTSFLRRNFPSSSNTRSCADDAIEDAFEASPPPACTPCSAAHPTDSRSAARNRALADPRRSPPCSRHARRG